MKIAFLGLGIMGSSMAKNLATKGHTVIGFNRSKDKVEQLKQYGIHIASSPQEAVSDCEIICTCVTNGDVVRSLLFDNETIKAISPNAIVIDFSTTSPSDARDLYSSLKKRNIHFLDAPVTGGDIGARDGTLSIMVGGDEEILERALPIMNSVGKRVFHFGGPGSGQIAKAVNQLVSGISLAAMAEGLTFGKKAGLPLEMLIELLTTGTANSWVLEKVSPRVLKGDFAPGFHVKNQVKDLNFSIDEATKVGVDLPFGKLVRATLQKLIDEGKGDLGNQSIVQVYGF